MTDPDAPAAVQRQLDAYNARDLERTPGAALGRAEPACAPDRARGNGQHRHRHETVRRTFPEGTGTVTLVAVHEVVAGRIQSQIVHLGAPQLDAPAA